MAFQQSMVAFPNISWKYGRNIELLFGAQSCAKANVYTWFLREANTLIVFRSEFLGAQVRNVEVLLREQWHIR